VICGSPKLPFYCELAHPLDVGVKLPRFRRKNPQKKKKKKLIEREGVKGIVDPLRFLKMIEYPNGFTSPKILLSHNLLFWGLSGTLSMLWLWPNILRLCSTVLKAFKSWMNTFKSLKGVVDLLDHIALKSFKRMFNYLKLKRWWMTTFKKGGGRSKGF
jgi:hypothetical protein